MRHVPLLVVLAVGIVARVVASWGLDFSTPHDLNRQLYAEAILHHFWDYIAYVHNVGVGVVLRDAFLFYVGWPDAATAIGTVLAMASGIVAAGLACVTLCRIGVPGWLAAVVGMVLSLRLVPMEVPTFSWGWDVLIPFLLSAYVYGLLGVVQGRGRIHYLIVGASGGFLSIYFQPTAPLVLGTALLAAMFPRPFSFKDAARRFTALAAIPVLFIGGAVIKNGAAVGVYSVSSGAGENISQNLNFALPSDRGLGVLDFAEERGYPHWWLWCYQEAERRQRWSAGINGAYGSCAYAPDGYDFSRLIDYLDRTGEARLAAIVRRDAATARQDPWMFAGATPTRATRFAAQYGLVSQKLLWDVIRYRTRNYLGRIWLNIDSLVDPFPKYLLPRDGHPTFVNLLNTWIAPFMVPILAISMLPAGFVPLAAFVRALRGRDWRPNDDAFICWVASLVVLGGVAISVAISCCDNARHAFNYLPLMFIVAAYVLHRGVALSVVALRRGGSGGARV